MSTPNPHDLFVRTTTATGKTSVSVHRVWDADRFIAARHSEGKVAGDKKAEDGYTVAIITKAEYARERKQ